MGKLKKHSWNAQVLACLLVGWWSFNVYCNILNHLFGIECIRLLLTNVIQADDPHIPCAENQQESHQIHVDFPLSS